MYLIIKIKALKNLNSHIIHMEERITDVFQNLENKNEIQCKIMITYIHQVQSLEYVLNILSNLVCNRHTHSQVAKVL